MREIKVKIDESLSSAVQARQMELDSIKNLLGFAYSTTTYAIPESRIEKLEKEFNEINTEYNLLKNQIELIAIPSDFNKAKTSWNLEFDNSEVTVTEND